MARLTIASLSADLAAKNISLTGKTGAYITVVPSGFSCSHKTLAEVKEYVEEHLLINSFVEPELPEPDPTHEDLTEETTAIIKALVNLDLSGRCNWTKEDRGYYNCLVNWVEMGCDPSDTYVVRYAEAIIRNLSLEQKTQVTHMAQTEPTPHSFVEQYVEHNTPQPKISFAPLLKDESQPLTHAELVKQLSVENPIQYAKNQERVRQLETEPLYRWSDRQQLYVDSNKKQTEPTPHEAMVTQSTRVNQLYSEATGTQGMIVDYLPLDSDMAADEEMIGQVLVQKADKRRELRARVESWAGADFVYKPRPFKNHSQHYTFGFSSEITARVSAKLQRRANKFLALLKTA